MYEGVAALVLQKNRPQEVSAEILIEGLKKELDACEDLGNAGRKQVFNFMIREGIWHISDLGYEERVKFIAYLSGRYSKSERQMYRDDFDRIKRHGLSRPTVLPADTKIWIPPYHPKIFYLPYHPDERVRLLVERLKMEEALVWDFTRKAPENLKHQVYRMIHYILESDSILVTKRRHLAGLNRYYRFCVEKGIADLELVEQWQVREYHNSFKSVSECERYSIIVGICRRELFLRAKEINWDAHVWYMERFHLQPERLDPSKPVQSLSFVELEHAGNRKLLKEYLRYSLGTTYLSISRLQTELGQVRSFLIELGQENSEDARTVSAEQIDEYFTRLREKNIAAEAFNERLMSIHHFFCFLQARKQIRKLPFSAEYYRQKCSPHHLDRSVMPETAKEIIRTLHKLPEDRRLMYLHLWCLGLRVSEVCTLKGNAYTRQKGDTWLQVYQIKLREYKRVPMPEALYELMQIYLNKHQIGPEDYVFSSPSGGPYRSTVFCAQMRRFCQENQFQGGEYLFSSHDYRHRVATEYYDNGVSLQGIRDYLGHEHEEMTQQYIDFMPKRIENENDKFFEQHSLASCLNKGGRKNER